MPTPSTHRLRTRACPAPRHRTGTAARPRAATGTGRGWADRYEAFLSERADWPAWMHQWRRDNPVGSVHRPARYPHSR